MKVRKLKENYIMVGEIKGNYFPTKSYREKVVEFLRGLFPQKRTLRKLEFFWKAIGILKTVRCFMRLKSC